MSCTSTQQCSIPRYRVRCVVSGCRLCLKRDGTRAETRFRLTAKRTSPFKSAGALVQSTAGSRVVRISGSNAGYTMFQGSVKGTGYPLHLPVSPSLPLPFVPVCHHVSTGVYCLSNFCGNWPWNIRRIFVKFLCLGYVKLTHFSSESTFLT